MKAQFRIEYRNAQKDVVTLPNVDVDVPAWIPRALRAALEVLGWRSIGLALYQVTESEESHSGSDDGYNMSVVARMWVKVYGDDGMSGSADWVIEGGCGYGSKIRVDRNSFSVMSCGGHFVAARENCFLVEGVEWQCDANPSQLSWGDGDEPDVAKRIERLQNAFRNQA